jgi:hypothetical protein
MEKKIDVQFDKDLDYIIELKGELAEAKILMQSGEDKLDKYRGAGYILENYRHKYKNLSENAKKHLNVNMNDLEEMAVNILVNQGHSDIVEKDLLKKYGLYCGEGKK